MKVFSLLLLFIAISILPICYSSSISVCVSGCNFSTINDAVVNASPDDIILIGAGVYQADNILIEKPLTLQGNGAKDTFLVPSSTPTSGSFLDIYLHSGNLNIRDLSLNLSGNYNGLDIKSNISSSTIDITDIMIVGDGVGPAPYDIGIFIHDYGQARVQISDSIFDNLAVNAILVEKYLGEIELSNCKFNNTNDPIYFRTFDNLNVVSSQRISNNTFDMSGIGAPHSAILIRSASASSSDRRGRFSNIQILNNSVFGGVGSSGFELWNDANVTAIDGEISASKINGNYISGSSIGGTGIALHGFVSSADLRYNEITGFAYGVSALLGLDSLTYYPSDTVLNYNNITQSGIFALDWNGSESFNAKFNWWGNCSPNFTSIINGNAIYAPWLGSCIDSVSVNPSCILEKANASLYANITNVDTFTCSGNVRFSLFINSVWTNFTAVQSIGNPIGNYRLQLPSLAGNTNIIWNLYVDDCYGHSSTTSGSFAIRKSTVLTINPTSPDGMNGWYVNPPVFSLFNPDAGLIEYRWNQQIPIDYIGSFSLEDTPNDANSTGGIIDLHYWSDVCNESEQVMTLKVDLHDPSIQSTSPANGSILSCQNSLKISATIDDFFGSNSGVNKSTIAMKLDSIQIANLSIIEDAFHDVVVSFIPAGLSMTSHDVELSGLDLSGRTFMYSWNFMVNFSNITSGLNLYSPLDGKVYSSRSTLFNLTALGKAPKIGYIDFADAVPKTRYFCSECIAVSKKLTLLNGMHNISVFVSDLCGNMIQQNVTFMIDALPPRIHATLPSANAFLNSTSNLSIDYSEENLKSITLRYGNASLTQNCTPGIKQRCAFKPDLSIYDNKTVLYWFTVNDLINSKNSTKRKINIDTTAPMITVNNMSNKNNSGKLIMNLTFSEPIRLQYSVIPNKWNTLCSDCISYGNTATKSISLKDGNYTIILKATDRSQQTDSKINNISVT